MLAGKARRRHFGAWIDSFQHELWKIDFHDFFSNENKIITI